MELRLLSKLKILILKSSSLGDVVQALPVLRLLKQHDPSSQIFWWLSADLLSLLESDPDLTGIFPFARHRWVSPQHWDELLLSVQQIREHAFDWVIDLQGLARSGFIAWLACGKLTVGLDDLREGAAGFYDLLIPRPSYYTHAVDWYLGALPLLGVPKHENFTWLPFRKDAASAIEQRWHPGGARWVIVNPGARWFNKRWPAEFYRELVQLITRSNPDVHVAVMGGKADAALGEAIVRGNPHQCLDLTGKTSLPEMIEWIRLSELIVTNDTGPMHVAAALDKPVVGIFGPTEQRRTGPYQQVDEVIRIPLPCAPCLKSTCAHERPLECLRAIPPSAVFAQVQKRLAKI